MKFVAALTFVILAFGSSHGGTEISPAFDAIRDTIFLLFTRFNPTVGQVVSINDMNTVRNSNWDANRPTRVIIHGHLGDARADVNILLTAAFLASGDFNVLVVDWGAIANQVNYITARNQVHTVGGALAIFLDNLHEAGLMNFETLTIAGHSLGGHVAGFAGKRVTRGRVQTIFGLNPAGPLFSVENPVQRLDSTDAVYVEVIHTQITTTGIGAPIGHANFYANGGTNQPGCILVTCDHARGFSLFAESLRSDRLWGRQCNSMEQMHTNACSGPGFSLGGNPSGPRLNLRGIFRLSTASSSPFGLGPF